MKDCAEQYKESFEQALKDVIDQHPKLMQENEELNKEVLSVKFNTMEPVEVGSI